MTQDIVDMTSEIPSPHLLTNTFVHKDAVEALQKRFPEIIKCRPDRCVVGNKDYVKPGVGYLGKDDPQAGRWFKWWHSKK